MVSGSNHIQDRVGVRKEVFKQLDEDFFLPSPSSTVMEVMRLCNSEETSLSDLAELIQTDPALSIEILKYANSAFMATGTQVASVQKATVKLGMQTVVVLAMGFSLLASNKSGLCKGFDYPLFWQTSLAEALAAREIAKLNKGVIPDDLFICGLLSHMGAFSLAAIFPELYAEILETSPRSNMLKSREYEKFGIDSAELTTELFLHWGLPGLYALATGFHEELNHAELESGNLLRTSAIINIAHHIAKMCQSTDPQVEILKKVVDSSEKYGIEIGVFSNTFSIIVESWHEHGKLFEISTGECYQYSPEDE